MAISFSRPDPSSPAAVAEATFNTGRRGFDQQEVREFLRMVSAELARLQERERFLERELRTSQSAAVAEPASSVPLVDEETVARLLGEETARILTTAHDSATQITARAEEGAGRMLREATDAANRQREEAEVEAARRRSDAATDAEAELALAKQQGREMVEEARAYRERVLGELARRRELAREQIDHLLHGRDRLVQAFERARLVASDVVSELSPLSEPEEYVDLSPTTGPVPLTVPAATLADRSSVAGPLPGEAALTEPEPEPDADNPFVVDATGETPRPAIDEVPVADDEAAADDEVRADDDAGPDEDTDRPELDVLVETVETSESQAEEPPPAEDVAVDTTEVDTTNVVAFPTLASEESSEPTEVDGIFARLRAEQSTAPPADDAVSDDDDELAEDTPFSAREAAIVPLIVAGARKLKRRLADEQNEVLDALRRQDPVRSLDALLPWESEQSQRYADAITVELVAAAQAGVEAVSGPVALDLGPTGVLAPAREALATDVVLPLRERLERTVADADGDNDVIAKRVRAVYREWKNQRIDEHLDDVFRSTYARAGFESIEAGTRVTWVVDPDGPASPDCEDNSLAEPVTAGDSFPTGHTAPPAHPGCRCLLQIVD